MKKTILYTFGYILKLAGVTGVIDAIYNKPHRMPNTDYLELTFYDFDSAADVYDKIKLFGKSHSRISLDDVQRIVGGDGVKNINISSPTLGWYSRDLRNLKIRIVALDLSSVLSRKYIILFPKLRELY